MITGNFSKSAAQFLQVGACGCAHYVSCFQDDLSVLKAFTLKFFKRPNKKVFLLNDKYIYQILLFLFRSKSNNLVTQSFILVVAGFLDPPLFFFSTMKVGLSGCLATCHPEWMLRKTI